MEGVKGTEINVAVKNIDSIIINVHKLISSVWDVVYDTQRYHCGANLIKINISSSGCNPKFVLMYYQQMGRTEIDASYSLVSIHK